MVLNTTIITALSNGSSVWLGNNNAFTIGDVPMSGNFDPWLKFGNWALGITGDSFQQDFLSFHSEKLSEHTDSPYGLTECIRNLFLENYISSNSNDHASASFGIWCILVHKNGRVWDVDGHLSLAQIPTNKIWARGSGIDFALGADFAIGDVKSSLTPSERIKICTQAAISNDIGCPGDAVVKQFV